MYLITALVCLLSAYISLLVILNLKKLFRYKGDKISIAFFHPFCNDGGGGQKVLWCIVKALIAQNNKYLIAIYSLQLNKDEILKKASSRFGIDFSEQQCQRISIIYVPGRKLLEPKGFLTMVFHIILPIIYTLKSLWKLQPDIFYDTTGFAFNFIAVKLLLPTTKCFAYVHYPFISYDMIQKISDRREDYNNQQKISKSLFFTKLKIFYYIAILFLYRLVRFFTYFCQTNSSWTYNHMKLLWGSNLNDKRLVKLYPPCSVQKFLKFDKNYECNIIMSLAQFRPEKNQMLQIEVFNSILKKFKGKKINQPILRICGTTRGKDDQKILENLRKRAAELKLQNNIEFKVNMPYSGVLQSLRQSNIGIHTMQAEHFGISVVEMMAAGIIVVAHNSAGPKQDIIKDQKFLATSQQDYQQKIFNIIEMPIPQRQQICKNNRQKSQKYGQSHFMKEFLEQFEHAINGFPVKQV